MPIAFDLELHVHYGFVWLYAAGSEAAELNSTRGGQQNGILGGAVPGVLSMMTGLHTGTVPFGIEIWEREPALAAGWEDVVEVSFDIDETSLVLASFQQSEAVELATTGSYRARYCASGMDEAHAQDTRVSDDQITDRYLLVLWPSPPLPERVVIQTSQVARYWAGVARDTAPPHVPTEAELRAADEAAREEKRRHEDLQRTRCAQLQWRGVEPTPAMRRVGPAIAGLAKRDHALAELVATTTPTAQREIAVWAARSACDHASDAPVEWDVALDALARGEPLPPPFDDIRQLVTLLFRSGGGTTTTARVAIRRGSAEDRRRVPIHPSAAAVATLDAAQNPGPAVAAIRALEQAVAGRPDLENFYAQTREAIAALPDH